MFPKCGPSNADIRSGDNHAVNMSAQLAAGRLKSELRPVLPFVAKIKSRAAQPADRERLELMAGIEDAQHLPPR